MQAKGMSLFIFIAGKATWIANTGLHPEEFEISAAYMYNMNSAAKREIRKIIFDHFESIEKAWDDFQQRKSV